MPSPTPVGTITTAVNSTAGTSCAPAIPSGLTNGQHWMVLAVSVNGNKTASMTNPPTGWTTVLAPSLNSASTGTLGVWKKLFATGDGAPTVSWTSSNKNDGCIIAYKDADLTTPIDVTVTSGTGSSTTPTSPTATALTMGATLLHIHARVGTGAGTPPFNMVERVDITSTSTSPAALYVMDQAGMASDAAGTRASTVTSASWIAVTIWLRPATPTTFGLVRSAATQGAASGTVAATLASADCANSPANTCVIAGVNNGTSGVGANDISGVAWPGNALTKARAFDNGATYEASVWYKPNAALAGAATTVTATRGTGTGDMSIWVGEYKGLALSSPFDTSGAATTITTSMPVTTDAALASGTELCIDVVGDDGATPAFDANYTPLCNINNTTNATLYVQGRERAGGSTETANFTTGSGASTNVAVIAAFKATGTTVALAGRAGGGGGSTGLTLRPLAGTSPGATPRPTAALQRPLAGRASAVGKGQTLFPMAGRSPAAGGSTGLARPAATGRSVGLATGRNTPARPLSGTGPATGRGTALGRPAASGSSPAGGRGSALPRPGLVGRGVGLASATGQRGPVLSGAARALGLGRGLARPASSGAASATGSGRGTPQRLASGRAVGLGGGTALGQRAASGRAAAAGRGSGLGRPMTSGIAPASGRATALGRPATTATAPGRATSVGTPGHPALRGTAPASGRATGTLTAGALVALVGRGAGTALVRGLVRLTASGQGGGVAGAGSTAGRALAGHSAGQAGGTGTLTASVLVALVGRAVGGALVRATSGRALRGTGPGRTAATVAPAPTPLQGSTGINSSHGTLTVGTPLQAAAPARGGGSGTAVGGLRGRVTGVARAVGALFFDLASHRRGRGRMSVTALDGAQMTITPLARAAGRVTEIGRGTLTED